MRSDLIQHLSIPLDPSSVQPLPMQIASQLRARMLDGTLRGGDPLPSTRSFSARLGVARGSVVAAYEQLAAEGYVIASRGSGTMVNPQLDVTHPASHPTPPARQVPATAPIIDCSPGVPDQTKLADAPWRAAWRAAVQAAPRSVDPMGERELRVEVAEHLRHMRGLLISPENVMIAAGTREGLHIVLGALQQASDVASATACTEGDVASARTSFDGISPQSCTAPMRIGVESPGYPSLRQIPPLVGWQVTELPADANGLNPQALLQVAQAESRAGAPQPNAVSGCASPHAVLVTPSHQYPFGGSLPAPRRAALGTWASEAEGRWIIEDDFDSELRYVGMPLPTLTALHPEHSILLGTFSAVLSPGVACGYVVAPSPVIALLRQRRELLGQPVSLTTQLALAHYLASGALRRRTQRQRRTYGYRRSAVMRAFQDHAHATLMPIDGGLHAVLQTSIPAGVVVQRCYEQGYAITALDEYWGGSGAPNGVVFGFGQHNDHTLADLLRVIDTALYPSTPRAALSPAPEH